MTYFVRWVATDSTFEFAEKTLSDFPMPSDILATTLTSDSPHYDLEKLAEVALACEVLPPAGALLRDIARSAVAMCAADKHGNPMSCASSSAICHPDHSTLGGQGWLGMRAAANSRSGEKLAPTLGAKVLLEVRERFGFQDFFTGVQPCTAASEAVCRKMGLQPGGTSVVTVVDPKGVPPGKLTK